MSEVYIVHGWFGDYEWIECVCRDKDVAEQRAEKLWETRSSDVGPQYARGLHKFSADPYTLVERA